MNKRRGRAMTGEIRNEILHFGKLLSKADGLVYFSAKIGDTSQLECLAVVIESYDVSALPPAQYVSLVNSAAESIKSISQIIELGMTPDGKPFFISEKPNAQSLASYTFDSLNTLKDFLINLIDKLTQIELYGLDISRFSLDSLYFDVETKILFPSVKMLQSDSEANPFAFQISLSNTDPIVRLIKEVLTINNEIIEDYSIIIEEIDELSRENIASYLSNLGKLSKEDYSTSNQYRSEADNIKIINRGFSYTLKEKLGDYLEIFKKLDKRKIKLCGFLAVPILILILIFSGSDSKPELIKGQDNAAAKMESAYSSVKIEAKQPQVSEKNSTLKDDQKLIRPKEVEDILDYLKKLPGVLANEDLRRLIALTKDEDFEIRISAIRTLGEKAPKGSNEVISALMLSLRDEDYLVRGFAVTALTAYLEADAVPLLQDQRKVEDSEIVIAAIDRAIKRLELMGKRR